jgi:hypothetical protein
MKGNLKSYFTTNSNTLTYAVSSLIPFLSLNVVVFVFFPIGL